MNTVSTVRPLKDEHLIAVSANAPTIQTDIAKVLKLVQAEQTTVTPKEVSDHLARLTASYDDLTARYAENNERINAELARLKHDGGSLSGELHQLNAELVQQRNAVGALTTTTQTDVERLETGISALTSLLEMQETIISEQTQRLDQFDAAYALLDTATRGNKARIEVVREQAEKQHAVAQAHIHGLEVLHRDHLVEFSKVKHMVTALQLETQKLNLDIQVITANLTSHADQTHFRFKLTAGSVVALLAITLSGFALFKWAPAFTPSSVDSALTQSSSSIDGIRQKIAGLPRIESRTLEQEGQIGQLTNSVSTLEKTVAKLKKSLADVREQALGDEAATELQDSVWLLQQNPKSYTVQLLGVPTELEMASFVEQHAAQLNDTTLAFSLTRRDQRDRYNLFYGVFTSLEAANMAIAELPAELRAQKPWVRQISSVQATLR